MSDDDKSATPEQSERVVSLDVFRGLTIAGMVLVNNPGSWATIYWPLAHAPWHGWTPTDLIFPFFLFIVGVAIPIALARHQGAAPARNLYLKIMRRSLIIFALGLFLNLFPFFRLATFRIPGVLQRIAVCYFLAAFIFLKAKIRTQIAITAGLLFGYWLIVSLIPAPGYLAGDLSPEGSLPSFVDRVVFGKHIWSQGKVYDPEGLLSTIPALTTTLFGVLTGQWLRTNKTAYEKVAGLFAAGTLLVVVGWIWNLVFPINKALWTSSYAVFTAGMGLQFLAVCYWLIDIRNYRRWTWPFVVFGVNAIALFVGSGLMAKLLSLIKVSQFDGSRVSLHTWIYRNLFLSWLPPYRASLAFAISFILLWLFFMWLLYRKRIFIRV